MAALYTLKLRGLDSTGALTIATLDVTVDSDGMVRFTDAAGTKHSIPMRGSFARLVKATLQGTNGIASTAPMFDAPKVSSAGDGVRTDS